MADKSPAAPSAAGLPPYYQDYADYAGYDSTDGGFSALDRQGLEVSSLC